MLKELIKIPMKELFLFFILLFFFFPVMAQIEKPPTYKGCENEDIENLEACFNKSLTSDIFQDFKVPEIVFKENYKGKITVVFIVNKNGEFEILHIKAVYNELKDEVRRVFALLPTIQPATYNGRGIDTRYIIPINVPIVPEEIVEEIIPQDTAIPVVQEDIQNIIATNNTRFPEFESELNIPFTHRSYDFIVYNISQADNTHSSFKPYTYNEVKPYVDLNAQRMDLMMDKSSWAGRKLFNEHLVKIQGENYWFELDVLWDLQLGKDNSDIDYTYNNTRALQIQGGLNEKFSFFTAFYESQGRFADYINRYAISHEPNENSYGLVPGRGRAKQFKDNSFDYPVAEGYISYTPNEIFNFQFGHGKNFIGDGYRSLFLSDVTSPSTYLKISTNFWKIKYTNLWMWAKDVRPEVNDGSTLQKYIAIHHLSWNVTKRFNLGFFESVITDNSNKDGFNIEFFNPIIFYRAIEFSNGSRDGNALIGLDMKYQITNNLFFYDQIIIDEMTMGEVFSGDGYWGNKFGFQLGLKYFNAFKVDNLMLQLEYNRIRPYTNSHNTVSLNYGNFNQPLSHLWGGNFWETIFIARYNKNRWFGSAKFIFGEKGFDFDNSDISYGGDIYRSYDDRPSDYGNEIGQGNTTNIFITNLEGGWVMNPATNLQVFAGFTYRSFDQLQQSAVDPIKNTTWFTLGIRSELFNWYFDF